MWVQQRTQRCFCQKQVSPISVQDSALSHLLTPQVFPLFSCILSPFISTASFPVAYKLTFSPSLSFFLVLSCPSTAIVAFLCKQVHQQSCIMLVSRGLSVFALPHAHLPLPDSELPAATLCQINMVHFQLTLSLFIQHAHSSQKQSFLVLLTLKKTPKKCISHPISPSFIGHISFTPAPELILPTPYCGFKYSSNHMLLTS